MTGAQYDHNTLGPAPSPAAAVHPASALAAVYGVVCLVYVVFWVEAWLRGCTECAHGGAIPWVVVTLSLSGAAVGLWKARQARRVGPAALHYATLAFALGLLARSSGDAGYYLIEALTDDPPYPSPADVAYVAEVVLWIGGLLLLYWALQTSVLEEMQGAIDVLVSLWGLIIVAITLIRGEGKVPEDVGKLALDIFYPFAAAASCALVSALIFGPRLRELTTGWRWWLIAVYLATLLQFLANLTTSLLSSLPADHPGVKRVYWDGGPVEFMYVTAALVFGLSVAILPLGHALTTAPGRQPR